MIEVPTQEELIKLLANKDDWTNADKNEIFDALQAFGFHYYKTEKILVVEK